MTSRPLVGFLLVEGQNYKDKVPFYEGINIVGRSAAKSSITIRDKSISTTHAKVIVRDKRITIVDTESKNGVFLNSIDNQLEVGKEVQIDPQKDIVYFAQIKCQFKPEWLNPKKQQTNDITKLIQDKKQQEAEKKKQRQEQITLQQKEEKKQISKGLKIMVDEQEKEVENQTKKVRKDSKDKKKPAENEQVRKDSKKESLKESKEENTTDQEMDRRDKKSKTKKNAKNEKKKEDIETVNQEPSQQQKSQQKEEFKAKRPSRGRPPLPQKSKQKQQTKEQKNNNNKPKKQLKEKTKEEKDGENEYKSFYGKKNEEKRSYSGQTKGRKKNTKKQKSLGRKEDEKKEENLNRRKKPVIRQNSSSREKNLRRHARKIALCSGFKLSFTPTVRIMIVEDWRENFDVLIMDKFVRTFKLLLAICKGIPVVRSNWVIQSEYSRGICPIEKYVLHCEEKQIFVRSIEKVRSGFRVFQGLTFHLLSEAEEYHLETDKIQALIEAGGGIMNISLKKLTQKQLKNIIFIVRNEYSHGDLEKIRQLESDARVYKVELIMDSCFKQKIDWQPHEVIRLK